MRFGFSSFSLILLSRFSSSIFFVEFIYTAVRLAPIRTKSLDEGRENRSGNGEVDVVLEELEVCIPRRSGVEGGVFFEICLE